MRIADGMQFTHSLTSDKLEALLRHDQLHAGTCRRKLHSCVKTSEPFVYDQQVRMRRRASLHMAYADLRLPSPDQCRLVIFPF